MAALPVAQHRASILKAFRAQDALIIVSETGSGKTTQVPQFILDAGSPPVTIAVTQPRRVAAISVAQRVAAERGGEVGGEVGYTVRFDSRADRQRTRIKYITDGMLLREAMADPLLSAYDVVILDEVHERSVQTDILCAVAKAAQAERRARGRALLKVLLMSATLDAEAFGAYFGGAPCLRIEGRAFPVTVLYTYEPVSDYVEAAVQTVVQIHEDEATKPSLPGPRAIGGDVLVFLPGQEDIFAAGRLLRARAEALAPSAPALLVCELFAALSPAAQLRALAPAHGDVRKVILATNIAETSLTIPGVQFVVDSGVAKVRAYSARKAMDVLAVTPVSRASARQRAGRAGRDGPGKCFRLFTERSFHDALDDQPVPEIKRTNVTAVILALKAMGVADPAAFDFVDAPPRAAVARALESLLQLGALDRNGGLTALGARMARFPLEPTHARALLAAEAEGSVGAMLTLVASLSADVPLFVRDANGDVDEGGLDAARAQFASRHGDALLRVQVFNAAHEAHTGAEWCQAHGVNRRAVLATARIRTQLVGLWSRVVGPLDVADTAPGPGGGLSEADRRGLRRALAAGLFMQSACRQADGSYVTVMSRDTVSVHPSSCMFQRKAPCVVYQELVVTRRRYIRDVTAVDEAWLVELAPEAFEQSS